MEKLFLEEATEERENVMQQKTETQERHNEEIQELNRSSQQLKMLCPFYDRKNYLGCIFF